MVQELENELKKQINAKSIQNYLIKGPRGIGKTNLLRMILNRMFSDSLLSRAFLPLSFAEEEYSIITLRDFFIKILELLHIFRIDNDEISQAFQNYSQETDDETATENTISFLKNLAKKNNIKFLLLIDNFDLIFGDQIRQPAAAHRLRDVLMNNNFMLLIGTTPTYFADVMQYDEPLYNFFKLYDLDEFDLGTMESLLIKRAQFDNNVELAERIPKFRSRLEGLRHLTGGKPAAGADALSTDSPGRTAGSKSYAKHVIG